MWGHFHRNKTFDFCFNKARNLLKENGKLVVVYNSNKDFTGELIKFTKDLFKEVEFDIFYKNVIVELEYQEYDFEVKLKVDTFRELAEMIQVLMIVPDKIYYSRIDHITKFLECKLKAPEFSIKQKLLIV